MSESIVYDLTQEILNYREDSRSVIGNKFTAAVFEKDRSIAHCKNREDSIRLMNSHEDLASEFDQGPRNGLSALENTASRFARNDSAFQSPSALDYDKFGKSPSFSSQFKFAQPFRSGAPSIPQYSSLSTLSGISAPQHNFVQPVHIAQHSYSKYSNSAGNFTAVSRKMALASLSHLCESCFRPRGDHSKTCPQFIREQEEKEMRRTRVCDD